MQEKAVVVRMGKVMHPRLFPIFVLNLLPWVPLLSSQQFSRNSLSCNCFLLSQICSVYTFYLYTSALEYWFS